MIRSYSLAVSAAVLLACPMIGQAGDATTTDEGVVRGQCASPGCAGQPTYGGQPAYGGQPVRNPYLDPSLSHIGNNRVGFALKRSPETFRVKVGTAIPSPAPPTMMPPGVDPRAMQAGGPGMPGGGMGMPGCPPGMMPPGAGAPGVGAMPLGPSFMSGRTQVRFVNPVGMQVTWQVAPHGPAMFAPPQLEVPGRYNFLQANIYRLKVTEIPNRPGVELYPTLEVYPGNVQIAAYLTHNAVPIEFTDEDFDQVLAGNFVTKVIYLPDPENQELAIAGVETLVSTRLAPGVDPVAEAHRRGSILVVVRLGSVDLEMPHSPPLLGQGGRPTTPARLNPALAGAQKPSTAK